MPNWCTTMLTIRTPGETDAEKNKNLMNLLGELEGPADWWFPGHIMTSFEDEFAMKKATNHEVIMVKSMALAAMDAWTKAGRPKEYGHLTDAEVFKWIKNGYKTDPLEQQGGWEPLSFPKLLPIKKEILAKTENINDLRIKMIGTKWPQRSSGGWRLDPFRPGVATLVYDTAWSPIHNIGYILESALSKYDAEFIAIWCEEGVSCCGWAGRAKGGKDSAWIDTIDENESDTNDYMSSGEPDSDFEESDDFEESRVFDWDMLAEAAMNSVGAYGMEPILDT